MPNLFLVSSQVFSGNDESLDLSCALVDLQRKIRQKDKMMFCQLAPAGSDEVNIIVTHLVDLSIPHQLLHRVFAVEAVASEYLDGVSGHLIGDISCEGLGDGGVVRVSSPLIHFPGRPLVRHPRQLHLHCHLRQDEGHNLVL